MDEVRVETETASEKADFSGDDTAEYATQVFQMYNNPAADITIEFKDKLIDIV